MKKQLILWKYFLNESVVTLKYRISNRSPANSRRTATCRTLFYIFWNSQTAGTYPRSACANTTRKEMKQCTTLISPLNILLLFILPPIRSSTFVEIDSLLDCYFTPVFFFYISSNLLHLTSHPRFLFNLCAKAKCTVTTWRINAVVRVCVCVCGCVGAFDFVLCDRVCFTLRALLQYFLAQNLQCTRNVHFEQLRHGVLGTRWKMVIKKRKG